MTKFEEYTTKAAGSLAAADAATTERDRVFHRRAHTIWRRLLGDLGVAEEQAAAAPPPPKARAAKASTIKGAKAAAAKTVKA